MAQTAYQKQRSCLGSSFMRQPSLSLPCLRAPALPGFSSQPPVSPCTRLQASRAPAPPASRPKWSSKSDLGRARRAGWRGPTASFGVCVWNHRMRLFANRCGLVLSSERIGRAGTVGWEVGRMSSSTKISQQRLGTEKGPPRWRSWQSSGVRRSIVKA